MEKAPFPVIINRPRYASERVANRLRRGGVSGKDLIVSPVVAIIDKVGLLDLEKYTGVIFTSANAVRALARSRVLAGTKAFCVGEQTGNAALDAGFEAIVADGSADALCRQILGLGQQGPLLFARGGNVAVDVREVLSKHGLDVVEHVVYLQEERKLNAAALAALGITPCIVPLFSAQTARIFGEQAAELPNPGHVIVGISLNVTREFPLNWHSVTAISADATGVSQAVIRTWKAGPQRFQ